MQGNSLLVKFKGLHNITPRGYFIRWGLDTAKGYVTYETPYVKLGIYFSP